MNISWVNRYLREPNLMWTVGNPGEKEHNSIYRVLGNRRSQCLWNWRWGGYLTEGLSEYCFRGVRDPPNPSSSPHFFPHLDITFAPWKDSPKVSGPQGTVGTMAGVAGWPRKDERVLTGCWRQQTVALFPILLPSHRQSDCHSLGRECDSNQAGQREALRCWR